MNEGQPSRDAQAPVTVTYTFGDLLAVAAHSWRTLLMIILVGEAVLIAVLAGIDVVMGDATILDAIRWIPWWLLATVAVVWGVTFLFVAPLIGYIRARRQRILGPNLVSFRGDGIQLEGRQGQSLVYWSAIKRVVANRTRPYLFIRSRVAIVVPRRAVESDAEFEAFIGAAEERWRTHSRP